MIKLKNLFGNNLLKRNGQMTKIIQHFSIDKDSGLGRRVVFDDNEIIIYRASGQERYRILSAKLIDAKRLLSNCDYIDFNLLNLNDNSHVNRTLSKGDAFELGDENNALKIKFFNDVLESMQNLGKSGKIVYE